MVKELNVRFNNLSKLISSKLEKILIKLKRTGIRKAKTIGIRHIKYIRNFVELSGLISETNLLFLEKLNLLFWLKYFSRKNKKATINKRIDDNWIAAPLSFIEFHDLNIPIVYVFTPKYLTAPYSLSTSIITRNNPEKIAGLDKGKTTLIKVWYPLKPRFLARS